jgi:hypothetical protein
MPIGGLNGHSTMALSYGVNSPGDGSIAIATGADETSTQMTLASPAPAGWVVGDLILIRATTAKPAYITRPTPPDAEDGTVRFPGVGVFCRIKSISGTALEIDRPIFMPLHAYQPYVYKMLSVGTGGHTVLDQQKHVTHVGLRDLQIRTDPTSINVAPKWAYHPNIAFCMVDTCWMKGVRLYKAASDGVKFQRFTTECTIEGCDFDSLFENVTTATVGQYYSISSTGPASNSHLMVNNSFVHAGNKYYRTLNSHGNVFAYNFCDENLEPGYGAGNAYLLHGCYAGWNLIEGNHTRGRRCSIEADNVWGHAGPYETFFRNRLESQSLYEGRFTDPGWAAPNVPGLDGVRPWPTPDPPGYRVWGWDTHLGIEANSVLGPVWLTPNIIGNAAPFIGNLYNNMPRNDRNPRYPWEGGPPFARVADVNNGDVTFGSTDMLLEKNSYYHFLFDSFPDVGGPHSGAGATVIDNVYTGSAVGAWVGMPASLFYTARPSWWPGAKAWPCIGPDLDGLESVDAGNYITLPAEDRYNGLPDPPEKFLWANDIDGSATVTADLSRDTNYVEQLAHYKVVIFS